MVGGLVALVVGAIAYVLRPVGPAEPGRPEITSPAVTPVNPAAYDAVMRARYLSVRTTDTDTQAAIALLERAIALEPGFARAYADLAAAYVTRLTFVAPEETGELEQKAFAAAEKALSLDANLPEAYLARGDLLWTYRITSRTNERPRNSAGRWISIPIQTRPIGASRVSTSMWASLKKPSGMPPPPLRLTPATLKR